MGGGGERFRGAVRAVHSLAGAVFIGMKFSAIIAKKVRQQENVTSLLDFASKSF